MSTTFRQLMTALLISAALIGLTLSLANAAVEAVS